MALRRCMTSIAGVRLVRLATLGALALLSPLCFASPELLIVKLSPPGKAVDGDPNDSLIQFVAQEFDDDGRVLPVAWGLSDPFFRAAVDDKVLLNPPDKPDLSDAEHAASKLKAEYVLAVSVQQVNLTVYAVATLYHKGKEIWHDPSANSALEMAGEKNRQAAERLARKRHQKTPDEPETPEGREIKISLTGRDSDNELRSLARTWATLLEAGPLKALPPKPKPQNAKVDPGQKPAVVDPPPPVHKVDNQQLLADAMKLLGEKRYPEAITMLRDAVDAEPMDVERRRALVMALMQGGDPSVAADEAQRAAAVLPNQSDLRTLAARAYLRAGKADEALAQLKEAVAHDPDGVDTRMLIGELDLSKGQLRDAQTQFDFVLTKSQLPDAMFDRAIVKSLLGDSDGAAQDLQAADKAGLDPNPVLQSQRLASALRAYSPKFDDFADRSRGLLQRAKIHPDDAAVVTDADQLGKEIAAASSFFDAIAVPAAHKASHERLLLALKLLTQAISDIEDYLKAHSDDTFSDATINVGEGLKNLKFAREALARELAS